MTEELLVEVGKIINRLHNGESIIIHRGVDGEFYFLPPMAYQKNLEDTALNALRYGLLHLRDTMDFVNEEMEATP